MQRATRTVLRGYMSPYIYCGIPAPHAHQEPKYSYITENYTVCIDNCHLPLHIYHLGWVEFELEWYIYHMWGPNYLVPKLSGARCRCNVSDIICFLYSLKKRTIVVCKIVRSRHTDFTLSAYSTWTNYWIIIAAVQQLICPTSQIKYCAPNNSSGRGRTWLISLRDVRVCLVHA